MLALWYHSVQDNDLDGFAKQRLEKAAGGRMDIKFGELTEREGGCCVVS